ncbi:unnamed protein product [Cylindrotheca closterium]|uniref:Calmodulin-lysine N-methyltransferase n=1 Tax=Cylindrotheca closterium TaxID=2856 RepID=A0AAD2CU48_9STRA|nr:unnamed protein product [Cylindrotheca closterium]
MWILMRFWMLVLLGKALVVNGDDLNGWSSLLSKTESMTTMSCTDAANAIQQFVKDARLSAARSLAQTLPPTCEKQVSKAYIQEADMLLEILEKEEDGFQQLLTPSLKSDRAQATIDDAWICSIVDIETLVVGDYWEKCCSSLWEYSSPNRSPEQLGECFPDGIPVCCEFFEGSPSHLRLPVLRELAIRLRLTFDDYEMRFIALEQDGFLRPFDVSTVQWPAGYFLALCVAAPVKCGIPELESILTKRPANDPIAIELGSGLGASSIALAMATLTLNSEVEHSGPPLVIATDNSLRALALNTANIAANSLTEAIKVQRMDHFDMDQVQQLKQSHFGESSEEGFSLVLGSSLLSFFVDTDHPDAPLWQTLDILLHSEADKPPALALLVHSKVEPVHPPSDGTFRLVRRISGDIFEMRTRSAASSDFELSIFERCDDGCRASERTKASGEGEL